MPSSRHQVTILGNWSHAASAACVRVHPPPEARALMSYGRPATTRSPQRFTQELSPLNPSGGVSPRLVYRRLANDREPVDMARVKAILSER